jgi:ketosteroid isomerase-like protein
VGSEPDLIWLQQNLTLAMTNSNQEIMQRFYAAFNERDYATMQSLYHDDATFSDPVFQALNSTQVKAMWQMLLTASKDLQVSCRDLTASDQHGRCRWDAFYTFSQTQRKVHNVVRAQFVFKDGKIIKHTDWFNFWRWSRMALGVSGLVLGWTPFLKNKVKDAARRKLDKYISTGKP